MTETYAEMLTWTAEKIKIFLTDNPAHIGAGNALREVERHIKSQSYLNRYGKRHNTMLGWTHVMRRGKCPSKKNLK